MVYIRVTSNSIFERSLQHPGEDPLKTYTVKQISPRMSAFTRHLEEAHLIKSFKQGVLLNLKYEYYNSNSLPSLTSNDKKCAWPQFKEPVEHVDYFMAAEEKRKMLWEKQDKEDNNIPSKKRKNSIKNLPSPQNLKVRRRRATTRERLKKTHKKKS